MSWRGGAGASRALAWPLWSGALQAVYLHVVGRNLLHGLIGVQGLGYRPSGALCACRKSLSISNTEKPLTQPVTSCVCRAPADA